MRPRKPWTQATRREVLLRCCFRCTLCLELAGDFNFVSDLHHGVLRSEGGLDSPNNLLGLCRRCHEWVHKDKGREELARRLLAKQIEESRVRIDPVARSVLFEEVEKAAQSHVTMRNHTTLVYASNSWNNYEVFLKAAWAFLESEGWTKDKTATVLLYHFVNLYRRRPGKRYNRAAGRFLQRLKKTYSALPDRAGLEWLEPKILYQEGYLHFLSDAASLVALGMFNRSAEFEASQDSPVGRAISAAQATAVRLRQGEDVEEDLRSCLDALADTTDLDGIRWYTQNMPIHRGCVALMKGDYTLAAELVKPITAVDSSESVEQGSRPAKALYVLGLATFQVNETPDEAIQLLEASRKSYWASALAEGRGSVMVSLGDAYWSAGDRGKAAERYREALSQPAHMDNQRALAIAERRLADLQDGRAWTHVLYHPWQ